jgi:REDY-like protein HapK
LRTIVHKIRLRSGVTPASFERWVKECDYATCPLLPSLISFDVHRLPRAEGAPPEYMEVIRVHELEAFERDMQTRHFAALVQAFDEMATVVEEMSGTLLEPGYSLGNGDAL